MRKYIYYSGIFITLLLTLNSCEKEMMNYEGEDALYFDVRSSLYISMFVLHLVRMNFLQQCLSVVS